MITKKTFEGTEFTFTTPDSSYSKRALPDQYVNSDNLNYLLRIESDGLCNFHSRMLGTLWCSRMEFEFNLPQLVRPNGSVSLGQPADASLRKGVAIFFKSLAIRPFENLTPPFSGGETAVLELFEHVANDLELYEEQYSRPVFTQKWETRVEYGNGFVASATVTLEPRLTSAFYDTPYLQELTASEILVLNAGYSAFCGDGMVEMSMEDGSVEQLPARQVVANLLNEYALRTDDAISNVLFSAFNYRYPAIEEWTDSLFELIWDDVLESLYTTDIKQWAINLDTKLRKAYGKKR